jgi:G3E family GTPase
MTGVTGVTGVSGVTGVTEVTGVKGGTGGTGVKAVQSAPAASSPATAIPFTVIGGFLGAGKTTLLQRWLQQAAGQRIAVLVNDFGAINLDAALVSQAGAQTIALSNGCVCCSIGDDLSGALMRVLKVQPPFDAVVVEASGVSDPWRIAQIALVEPRLTLHSVIVLVDAAGLPAQLADPLLADTVTRPLAHADLVLLNHADRATPAALAQARAWVTQHAGPVPLLESVHADLPLALLGPALYQPHGGLQALPADHDTRFEAWQACPTGDHEEAALRAWLQDLPAGVLRLKGWLRTGPDQWAELQFAGRHGRLRRWVEAPPGGAALVAVGLRGQLPTQALAEGLAACAVETDRPAASS